MEANENLYREKERKIYFKPLLVFLGCFVGEIVLSLLIQIIFYTRPIGTTLSWFGGKLGALIAAIAFFIGYFKDTVNKMKHHILGFFVFTAISFGIFFLFEMGTTQISNLLDKLFHVGESTNQQGIYALFKACPTTLNYVLIGIAVVLLAPMLEELEFRTMIFETFKGIKWIYSAIISAVLFGLIHLDFAHLSLMEFAYFPLYALPGFALALIYHFSGNNVFVSFTCHALLNGISFIQIMLRLPEIIG